MLLKALLVLAALPGATNPRTLILGPKVKSASEDIRMAAEANLAMALEESKLMTRRLRNGNLIDIKGKELLKTPIAVMLRSLLQAGCEKEICAKELRKAFSRLGGVARVTIQPVGAGAIVRVWARGIKQNGSYAQRLERSAVIEKLNADTVAEAVRTLSKGITDYRPQPVSDPATLVMPKPKKVEAAPAVTLTDLAPWKVIADQKAREMAAALEAQRKERESKAAAIQAERESKLQKVRDAQAADEAERAAKAEADRKNREAERAEALKKWQSTNVGGEFMARWGISMVEGGGQQPSLGANLRLPLGKSPVRAAFGVEVGAMPLDGSPNANNNDQVESWIQLTPSMEPVGCEGKGIDACEHQFWYQMDYHRFVSLGTRLDLPLVQGDGGFGIFLGGDLGLGITHGTIYQIKMQVDGDGNVRPGSGQEVRTTNDSFTWAGFQYAGQVGIWVQMPKWPVTLNLAYRMTSTGLEGVRTMKGDIFADESTDPAFSGGFSRQQLMLDLGYRF